jgi:hypothetical protein
MAERFLRQLAGDKPTRVSAAIEPAPVSRRHERSWHRHFKTASRARTAFKERFAFAGDQAKVRCPVFPFAFRLFRRSLEDPAAAQGWSAERLAAYRRVRDQICGRVREFVDQLSSDSTLSVALK